MKNFSSAIAVLALAAPAPLALAQGEGFSASAAPVCGISREDDSSIARDKGMSRVRKVERDDGKWEPEGCTADRKEIEVDIRRGAGDMVKFEIDNDDDDDDC
ncbi:MAG: hypothetical protein WEA77_14210 [Hyphomonas sp.]|uniref:PepSY domain-containing protein n=1 Tax=Hyphomonas sp. TaxID=87 RepID=UPI0034A08B13